MENKTFPVESSRTKSVKGEKLAHGDRLFMFPKSQNLFGDSSTSSSSQTSSKVPSVVVEDDIDKELSKLDGKIPKENKGKPSSSMRTTDDLPYDPYDEEKYVPDVFFMEKDKYKNEIKKIGRPLPVEYLLLDVTVSAPIEPLASFSVLSGDKKHFPVENKLLDSSLQDFNSFAQYMSQFRSAEFLTAVSDIHVLVFLATLDIMPLRDFLGPLYEAIRTKNEAAAREWSYLDHWSNMQALIQASTMN